MTTAFTEAAFNANDTAEENNTVTGLFRMIAAPQTRVRFRFNGDAGGSFVSVLAGASCGLEPASPGGFGARATPTPILFGAAAGYTFGVGEQKFSDWLTIAGSAVAGWIVYAADGDRMIIRMAFGATANSGRMGVKTASAVVSHAAYKAGDQLLASSDNTGWNYIADWTYGVDLIETDAGAGGGPAVVAAYAPLIIPSTLIRGRIVS